jgi:hypothetical protein
VQLFFKDGDTVTVGEQLFKISVGAVTEVVKPMVPIESIPVPAEAGRAPHERVPLIKFLGPRLYAKQKTTSSVRDAVPVAAPVNHAPQREGNRIFYGSVSQMPKRYQPIPFSDSEIFMIDVRCLFHL